MPPYSQRVSTRWAGFSILSAQAFCEITGLTLEQVLKVPGVEQMTRIQDGSQEEAIRIPTEVLQAAGQNQEAVSDAISQYVNGGSDADLRARIREIIDTDRPPASD
jgi:hypothetical protein